MKKLKYMVYGLVDPRTDQLFYIGKSCSGTKQMYRHTQPHSLKASNSEKNQILKAILEEDMEPLYLILDTAKNKKDLAMKERVQIANYRDHLTNMRTG